MEIARHLIPTASLTNRFYDSKEKKTTCVVDEAVSYTEINKRSSSFRFKRSHEVQVNLILRLLEKRKRMPYPFLTKKTREDRCRNESV